MKSSTPDRDGAGMWISWWTELHKSVNGVPELQYFQFRKSTLYQTAVMAAPTSAYKDRHFLAVIGDEVCLQSFVEGLILRVLIQDSVTGLLLAGIGVRSSGYERV